MLKGVERTVVDRKRTGASAHKVSNASYISHRDASSLSSIIYSTVSYRLNSPLSSSSYFLFPLLTMPKPLPEPKQVDDWEYFSVWHPYPKRANLERHEEQVTFAWWIACIMGGPQKLDGFYYKSKVRLLRIYPYPPSLTYSCLHFGISSNHFVPTLFCVSIPRFIRPTSSSLKSEKTTIMNITAPGGSACWASTAGRRYCETRSAMRKNWKVVSSSVSTRIHARSRKQVLSAPLNPSPC